MDPVFADTSRVPNKIESKTTFATPWTWNFPSSTESPDTLRDGRSIDTHFAYASVKHSNEISIVPVTSSSKIIVPVTKGGVLGLIEAWETDKDGGYIANRYRAIVIDSSYSPISGELGVFWGFVNERLVTLDNGGDDDDDDVPDREKLGNTDLVMRMVTDSSLLLILMTDSATNKPSPFRVISQLGKAELSIDHEDKSLKVKWLVAPEIDGEMFGALNDYALFSDCTTIKVQVNIRLGYVPDSTNCLVVSLLNNGFKIKIISHDNDFTFTVFEKSVVATSFA